MSARLADRWDLVEYLLDVLHKEQGVTRLSLPDIATMTGLTENQVRVAIKHIIRDNPDLPIALHKRMVPERFVTFSFSEEVVA